MVNGQYEQKLEIAASNEWQSMRLPASGLLNKHHQQPMADWSGTTSVSIKPAAGSDITQIIFADFEWSVPVDTGSVSLEDGKLYLTASVADEVDSFWQVMKDRSVSGGPISIGGVKYARGLGVHSDSKLTFNLDGQFSTFHVVPGPDDAHRGQLEMIILMDGKEVYRSGVVTSQTFGLAEALELPVAGANQLTLLVEQADGSNGGDHANWADAYLSR